MSVNRVLVVGGSGFVGSAVCRVCVARGWSVVSLSREGRRPSTSTRQPEWADKVEWVRGSAYDAEALKQVMPSVTAVVHTLGILLESDYKSGVSGLASGLANGLKENLTAARRRANPLAPRNKQQAHGGAYEKINRDSALSVLRAFLETRPDGIASTPDALQHESPFVYVSAEDVFRPFVPDRYILSKRQAENRIQRLSETARSMMQPDATEDNEFERLAVPQRLVRPVLVRPSLIYHPEIRPPSALPAGLLKASAGIQSLLPAPFQANTIASILTGMTTSYRDRLSREIPSNVESVANLLSIPPVHVDTVAEAICTSIEREDIRGVLGVQDMERVVQGRYTGSAFGHARHAPSPRPTL